MAALRDTFLSEFPAYWLASVWSGLSSPCGVPSNFALEPDSNTAAILAVSLASIGLDTRAKGGSESAVIVTVLMALTATLLVSGVVAYGLGRLHQGGLIQLAPFSVVGGGGLGHRLSISNTLFTCYKQIL